MKFYYAFLPSNPFVIGYDALMRPSRFATFLCGERRNMLAAVVATLIWIGTALAFVGLMLPQVMPLHRINLAAALLLSPWLALLISGLFIMSGDNELDPVRNALFWALRCQLAITPSLTLGLALGFVATPLWLLVSMLLLLGVWLGSALVVRLVRTSVLTVSAAVRWILAAGSVTLVGLMIWSPAFPTARLIWFFLPLLGFTLGLIRPLSWLWEVPLALALLVGARCGLAVTHVRTLHPVSLDELCLLPLPGLRALLVTACSVDLDLGGAWLLAVANHPGQRGAALGAVRTLIQQGTLAHHLLLWLCRHDLGRNWLHTLAATTAHLPPLLRGYTALMDVDDAGAWPGVIARHRAAFVQARHVPGGQAMLLLLDTGSAVLTAARWPAAAAALRALPAAYADTGMSDEPGALSQALHLIAGAAADDPAFAHSASTPTIDTTTRSLTGWPQAMLDAITDHLVFLLTIEEQRATLE
jgi:hypothetical protein